MLLPCIHPTPLLLKSRHCLCEHLICMCCFNAISILCLLQPFWARLSSLWSMPRGSSCLLDSALELLGMLPSCLFNRCHLRCVIRVSSCHGCLLSRPTGPRGLIAWATKYVFVVLLLSWSLHRCYSALSADSCRHHTVIVRLQFYDCHHFSNAIPFSSCRCHPFPSSFHRWHYFVIPL